MKRFETSDNGNLVVSADTAEVLIPILLEAHTEESDDASKMLAQLLREFGAVERATGTPGHDYTAIIQFGGEKWLVEDNNAWTRVYDPADADYDLDEVFDEVFAAVDSE